MTVIAADFWVKVPKMKKKGKKTLKRLAFLV